MSADLPAARGRAFFPEGGRHVARSKHEISREGFTLGRGRTQRDGRSVTDIAWLQVAGGAVFGALAAVAVYEAGAHPGNAGETSSQRAAAPLSVARESRRGGAGGPVVAGSSFPGTSGGASSGEGSPGEDISGSSRASRFPSEVPARVQAQLQVVQGKLRDTQREKRDLEAQLSSLEEELESRPGSSGPGSASEFELSPADWKALSAQSRIKYRVPCVLPSHASYAISPDELDHLGLSPEDGKTLLEAHRRSNSRVWSALRPLCAQALGDDAVADLLGTSNCLGVVERVAAKGDSSAAVNARRQVGEVHAGVQPPPEAPTPLFQAFMALTRESSAFEADLAESFGPEDAKRIAQNMRCADTRR